MIVTIDIAEEDIALFEKHIEKRVLTLMAGIDVKHDIDGAIARVITAYRAAEKEAGG